MQRRGDVRARVGRIRAGGTDPEVVWDHLAVEDPLEIRLGFGPIEQQMREEEGGRSHAVLTGDYASWTGRWKPGALPPGQPLRPPRPLFRKLDPERVVADELGRMEAAAAPA